jgi:hypothetical protein
MACYIPPQRQQGKVMTNQIAYLNPAKQRLPVMPEAAPALVIGRKYQLVGENLPDDIHGICGNQSFSAHSGSVLPRQNNGTHYDGYLWDSDSLSALSAVSVVAGEGEYIALNANTPVASNRFALSHTTLTKPEIQLQENGPQLSLQAGFDFIYTADAIAARLGVLNLVESHCFVVLKNGEKHDLLESADEQKMLFLKPGDQQEVINPIVDVSNSHEVLRQSRTQSISHDIPEFVEGIEMETMTVLEQYQTFFLHRELPFSEENIWTPACAPISWGWSIRIARRHDDEWGIARQKLLMPTVGHNGMEMPVWERNTRDL